MIIDGRYGAYLAEWCERIPCPLCGSLEFEQLYEGNGLRLNAISCVICTTCTHIYLNPRPTMDAYKLFYGAADYFELCATNDGMSLAEKMAQFDDDTFWESRYHQGDRLYARHLTGKLSKDDLVIDIGCGDGAWMGALHRTTGCRIVGQEVSPTYAKIVKRKFGIETFTGPVEELTERMTTAHAGEASLVIISGSLQHMLDPMACLKLARNLLRNDGHLYICNWDIITQYLLSYVDEHPRRMLGETLSIEHPHYFHEWSFLFMLENAGFDVLDFQLDSSIRQRHMDAFARKGGAAGRAVPKGLYSRIVSRIRALESATMKTRIRVVEDKLGIKGTEHT
jgi:SAM-dependent methyltransferase